MILKLRDGDAVPPGAKYLNSVMLPDESKAYMTPWRPAGLVSQIPIIGWVFGRETRDLVVPNSLFHIFEVSE